MTTPPQVYDRPEDLQHALDWLRRGNGAVSLLMMGPRMPTGPWAWADILVDLSLLRLDTVTETDKGIRLGSQVTLQTLVESPVVSTLASGILSQSAFFAAHSGLRNLATLGGLLVMPNDTSELILALLALEATVVTQGAEQCETFLTQFAPSEKDLILGVNLVRQPARCSGALARVARSPLDQAIVAAAAVVTDESARVAVSGVGPRPLIKGLIGNPPTDSQLKLLAHSIMADAAPIGDYRGSVEYRKAMAGVLAQRALSEAVQRMREK